MKALIVEDEPRAQRALENLLKANFPDVEVIGRAASVKETVDWLAGNRPDVIFMDVELADGTCFDIFAQTSVDAQVVMTTAYDNYAVKAFEVNSVDYLLKPVDVEELKRAVSRVEKRLGADRPRIDFDAVREAIRPREKFLIRLNDRIVPVSVRDIAYFYSEAKSTFIVTRDGKNYVLDDSLDAIEVGLNRRPSSASPAAPSSPRTSSTAPPSSLAAAYGSPWRTASPPPRTSPSPAPAPTPSWSGWRDRN